MTDAERKLWFLLRSRRFGDAKFRRQVPLGPYIIDFLCYEARLVIEADGSQHAECDRDKNRDDWLRSQGYMVLRFWNRDILKSTEAVLTQIKEVLDARTPHPAPLAPPSPARGEGKARPASPSEPKLLRWARRKQV